MNLETVSKGDIIKSFISHFENLNKFRLEPNDAQENNSFRWAAKLNSIEVWRTCRDILDRADYPAPLPKKNHFGETPWDIVLQSTDLEFVGDVLLDKLARNPDSTIIKDLLEDKHTDQNWVTPVLALFLSKKTPMAASLD